MKIIDRFIAALNPMAGLKRAQARMAISHVRRYEAAAKGRRTEGWKSAGSGSANVSIEMSLSTLRNRSRDLIRNTGHGKKAKRGVCNNTIGTGIQPVPILTGRKKETVKKLWKSWAETVACDWDGRRNFYGLQYLAMGAVFESGEVIIRRRRVPKNKGIPIQLQVCEGDFIDNSKSYDQLTGGGFIMQGIEFNADGKRVAYWLFDSHPGETRGQLSPVSKRVPVEDVLHVYDDERPGQIRGVPFLTPVMLRMKDHDEYDDAQLVRQKVAACFAAFVESPETGGIGGDDNSKNSIIDHIEPGIVQNLLPGETVTFAQPPTMEGYSDYNRTTLQNIAAGIGISYEAMTGDLSKVNFSSGRMGWLEMQRQCEVWQWHMIIPQLCEGVWNWFVLGANLIGAIREEEIAVNWTPPRREMIDPVKETEALISQQRAGILDYGEVVRQATGNDPEHTLNQIAAYNKLFDSLGIMLDSDGRRPRNRGRSFNTGRRLGRKQPRQ